MTASGVRPRSNEEIRADLERLSELHAAFRKRLAKARQRIADGEKSGGLSDFAALAEEHALNQRLAADVPALLVEREDQDRRIEGLRTGIEKLLRRYSGLGADLIPANQLRDLLGAHHD